MNSGSGVYQIQCRVTGALYVGSSTNIGKRWDAHRRLLRRGKSDCTHLQRAWEKHGEATFEFSVLENCPPEILEEREQSFLDRLKPRLNCISDIKRRFGPEMAARRAAALRARAAKVTHCPLGHEYNLANTHIDRKGKRICRACNTLRVAAVLAEETADAKARRKMRAKASYLANRAARLAAIKKYAAGHKSEKREYDRQRRLRLANEQSGSSLNGDDPPATYGHAGCAA